MFSTRLRRRLLVPTTLPSLAMIVALMILVQHSSEAFFCASPILPLKTRLAESTWRTLDTARTKCSQRLYATPKLARTIPVLGPIPGSPPLLVGEDYVLEFPSPLQWNTLEECLHIHELYLKEQPEEVVGIDAAPLVAVMDDVTSQQTLDTRNSKYATIAAIVGVVTPSKVTLDTSSEESFMESLQLITANQKDTFLPSKSKIRLVGIGRASLCGFHSRLPNSYWQAFDKIQGIQGDDEGLDDGEYLDERETPLLIAQFNLMVDTDQRSEGAQKVGRARFVSPVHALAEMSQWTAKLQFMHEDRQRLVRGLKAADARLKASTGTTLEDHDGIGLLSSGFVLDDAENMRAAQPDIDTLLEDFPGQQHKAFSGQSALSQVMQWKNYGMGFTAAAFSSIPPLTHNMMEKLQAYYSPQKQVTEEYYYEVLSFMAVLSLKDFLPRDALNYALKATNTMERMQWAYEMMIEHKLLLKDASEEISAELRDCGEECTDLW
ncbi:unnamed protein product [Cylindrotheca closterium]|uniref:Uncharacterized protein n=1 Tax=Cylindrotheca closterium TaxID=2856 RepID=A0AAD2FDV6_9STRA|nr:unnamed protein product [Cylindrotheca closterium]